jgi:hypothetical protein
VASRFLMSPLRTAKSADLPHVVLRPGDRIVIGQACGEPTTLIGALADQGRGIGGLSTFIATSFSGLFTPAATDGFSCPAWERSVRCGHWPPRTSSA